MKMKTNIIPGKLIADNLLQDVRRAVLDINKSYGVIPHLAILMVGDDPASLLYIKKKMEAAECVGIQVSLFRFGSFATKEEIIGCIKKLNNAEEVHGILIQLPLPCKEITQEVIECVNYLKDVDGFTALNSGLLNLKQDCLLPATPKGCLKLIKFCLGDDISGKKAVVLGRSQIVGRPMASMLVNENCTVTIQHSFSRNIEDEIRNADIIVSAIGSPNFLKGDYLKGGVCVIDVGITRIENAVVGDVDFQSASKIAAFISPVPGGVGPMTIASMLENVVIACINYLKKR